ncbi:MAG TPA: Pvc16 family protein [Candidatus Sulfotelmatobacter sp.]|nr:Pvc16 family protein [Candidatus Sulfotelmatobacter sp.]
MGLTPIGVLDLSLVTNTLISMLENYVTTASPLWQALVSTGNTFDLAFSGAMPDAVRKLSGCQLTFSLIHVTQDKFQRNSPLLNQGVSHPRAQTIPFQPMSLDLYYLLTAFSDQQYQQEQQAMSMALQFFYQTPILRLKGPLPPGLPFAITEEFVLSMRSKPPTNWLVSGRPLRFLSVRVWCTRSASFC